MLNAVTPPSACKRNEPFFPNSFRFPAHSSYSDFSKATPQDVPNLGILSLATIRALTTPLEEVYPLPNGGKIIRYVQCGSEAFDKREDGSVVLQSNESAVFTVLDGVSSPYFGDIPQFIRPSGNPTFEPAELYSSGQIAAYSALSKSLLPDGPTEPIAMGRYIHRMNDAVAEAIEYFCTFYPDDISKEKPYAWPGSTFASALWKQHTLCFDAFGDASYVVLLKDGSVLWSQNQVFDHDRQFEVLFAQFKAQPEKGSAWAQMFENWSEPTGIRAQFMNNSAPNSPGLEGFGLLNGQKRSNGEPACAFFRQPLLIPESEVAAFALCTDGIFVLESEDPILNGEAARAFITTLYSGEGSSVEKMLHPVSAAHINDGKGGLKEGTLIYVELAPLAGNSLP